MSEQHYLISTEQAGVTLAAFLRAHLPDISWRQARRLVEARRVRVCGDLVLDPARRLREGNTVELLARSAPKSKEQEAVNIRYLDEHLVVVEKPSGIATVRHPSEREWSAQRKALAPTVEDIVPKMIAKLEGRPRKGILPRLRVVQRLDKETSGLVVFARSVLAERELGRQFHRHTVMRRYLAIIPGLVDSQRIATFLVRDRGDGRRGSTNRADLGKVAITHVEVMERLPGYTVLSCRLETGRTHQIRIHLAELGHPVCGEKVYNRKPNTPPQPDPSGAPRLALHAAELGFEHPVTQQAVHWKMLPPEDLQGFLKRLRDRVPEHSNEKQKQRTTGHGNQMDRH
jgi:23S rRNA pseudouridine1911/1915/1917 synthase